MEDSPRPDPSPSPGPHAVTLAAVSSLSFSGDEMMSMTMIPVVTVVEGALDSLPQSTNANNTTNNDNDNNDNDNDNDNDNNNDDNDNCLVVSHTTNTNISDHHHCDHHRDDDLNFSFSDVYVANHSTEETMSITAGAHLLTTHRSIFIATATPHRDKEKDKDNYQGEGTRSGCGNDGGNNNNNNNNSRPPISPFRSPRVPSQRSSLALSKSPLTPHQRKGLTHPLDRQATHPPSLKNTPLLNAPVTHSVDLSTPGTVDGMREMIVWGGSEEEMGESGMWASVSSVRQETTAPGDSLPLPSSPPLPTTTTTATTTTSSAPPEQPMSSLSEPLPPSRWQSVGDMPRGHRAPFSPQTPRLRPSRSNQLSGGTDTHTDVVGGVGVVAGGGGGGIASGKGKDVAGCVEGMEVEGEEGRGVVSTAGAIVDSVLPVIGEIELLTDGSDWLSAITSADSKDVF